MIVVDSSVWIDFFNGNENLNTHILENSIKNNLAIIIPDLVLLEVLQGFKKDNNYIAAKNSLNNFKKVEILNKNFFDLYIENYRKLRKKGITIGTIDNIIASFCIANNLPLLFSDKDYNNCVKYLGLKNYADGMVN